jgi:hypothetical protein
VVGKAHGIASFKETPIIGRLQTLPLTWIKCRRVSATAPWIRRRSHSRLAAFVAALATYGFIVSVALTHDSLGMLRNLVHPAG